MAGKHQVVITGIGLATPVGNSREETWRSIKAGKSGISYLEDSKFDSSPYRLAGSLKNEQEILDAIVPLQKRRKMDRFITLGLVAAHEAMTDAGVSRCIPEDRNRFGVYLGVGIGGADSIINGTRLLDSRGYKAISPFMLPRAISNEAAAWVGMEWNLNGPSMTVVNACASSSDAVGHAFRSIRDGYVDYMVAGGTESSITPLGLIGFGNMRALSSWSGDPRFASRPFDDARSGFVMSEGAALLVLERKDKAVERGAKIYAEIVGYGATSDAYHITAPHPEGTGAAKAISSALVDASIKPSDVGYLNAHGTATSLGDVVETNVIKKIFGSHADPKQKDHLLVSSTKSMTGHLLGAAGGLEVAFSALALRDQIAPPTINLYNPSQECDLDYVTHKSRAASLHYAVSNSFGFGGANSVIVLKKTSF